MSWNHIRELIWEQRQFMASLASRSFPQESAFETQAGAFLASYLSTQSRVDAAVRQFAQTLRWPNTSRLEKVFIAARLDFAWEIAGILGTAGPAASPIAFPPSEECKQADLLEWLLVAIWPFGCARFLAAGPVLDQPLMTEEPQATRPKPEPDEIERVA